MNAIIAEQNYQKPIFNLEFTIYGTGAEIRLNDIPVYYSDSQGKTTSQKAVPESIIDGENVLSVRSFPLKEDNYNYREGAYIEAVISVRENDASPSTNKPILQLKLNPNNTQDKLLAGTLAEDGQPPIMVSHTEKQTIATRRTQIMSPFPRWAWQDGQVIEDTPENFNGLLEKYKEIWEALNSGNREQVKKLYDPAAQEYAWAYHYQDKAQGHRLMDTGGFIGDDKWGLGNINNILKKVKFRIFIYANGKLAYLVDEDNEPSLITYLNKSVRMINTQKFGFYKNKNGEWIMIR